MKLLAHPAKTGTDTAGLPGEEVSLILCPSTPAYKAALAGHVPAKEADCLLHCEEMGSASAFRTSRRTHPEETHACHWDVADIPLAALSNEGKAGRPAIVNSFMSSAALAA